MKTDNQQNVKEGQQIGSKIKKSNFFNEFFWICSGANRHILRQCPTEYSKYFGIGGTIFFTAAMATLSGGYAFYTIFDSTKLAIVFGIFWGLLIFNLDRFIVNTMYSDGKHTISWSEFLSGLPRIIIAIFLGIVISTPLELKIFEDEINVEIDQLIELKLDEYIQKDSIQLKQLIHDRNLVSSRRDTILLSSSTQNMYSGVLDNTNDMIQNIVNTKKQNESQRSIWVNRKAQYQKQLNNTTDSLEIVRLKREIRNCNSHISAYDKSIKKNNGEMSSLTENKSDILSQVVAQKEADINKCNEEMLKLDTKIAEVEAKIANAKTTYKEKLDKEFRGFQAHMLAFKKIKDQNSSTRIVSLFIMLLFIIIETAPTLFKMMIASGPYDELLNEEMERKKAHAITNVSRINDDANTQIQIVVEKNKDKLAAEVAANKEILAKIASVQAELLETAIEEWRKEELAKIKANPSQYIQSNTKRS